MTLTKIFFTLSFLIFILGCSTITKNDCSKNMRELGREHGAKGLAKKYTDELEKVCRSKNPDLRLDHYDEGFLKGWVEYCLPNRAYELGKNGEQYVSFCPTEREALFRQKYLLGKEYNELKETEEELIEKISEFKNDDVPTLERKVLDEELLNLKKKIQMVELEGKKDQFKFH